MAWCCYSDPEPPRSTRPTLSGWPSEPTVAADSAARPAVVRPTFPAARDLYHADVDGQLARLLDDLEPARPQVHFALARSLPVTSPVVCLATTVVELPVDLQSDAPVPVLEVEAPHQSAETWIRP